LIVGIETATKKGLEELILDTGKREKDGGGLEVKKTW